VSAGPAVRALVIGGGAAGEALAVALTHAGARIAQAGDPVDLVLIPVTDVGGLAPAAIVEGRIEAWRERLETPLRSVWAAFKTAHARLRDQGGAVVLIVPSDGMTGAPGLTAYLAAAEGARSLAKAAARAWAAQGVRVNCIAADAQALHGDLAALRRLAALAVLLARSPAGVVSGQTLVADGAEGLMVP
jgi:NAD(P)-dependent dehydrogenase (short-subunit alcohol dehydrogenase family)